MSKGESPLQMVWSAVAVPEKDIGSMVIVTVCAVPVQTPVVAVGVTV